MRCLGIDYGTKRVGLAHGDEIGVATPLPALTDADEAARWVKLGEVIKQAVQETLDRCGGNKSEAARRLGISRPRLVRLLEGGDDE